MCLHRQTVVVLVHSLFILKLSTNYTRAFPVVSIDTKTGPKGPVLCANVRLVRFFVNFCRGSAVGCGFTLCRWLCLAAQCV